MSDRSRLPKEVRKASSNTDLRNQLSDLQNRLVNARSHNSAAEGRRATQPDASHHVQKQPTSQVSTPKSAAPSRVDFLVGVSDGLLAECRKLTAENSKLKQVTNEQQKEFLAMSTKISNLTDLNSKLLREEEASKESNWELETKLQTLSREISKTKSDLAKAVKSSFNENTENSELKAELETEKLKTAELSESLTSTTIKLKQECTSLKQQNEDLNNENDELHGKLSQANEKFDELQKSILEETVHKQSQTDENLVGEIDTSDLLSDDESQTNPRDVFSSNFPLEKESLEASLMHANKTIAKLKKSVLKHKIANEELERKVLVSESFKPTSSNSPSSRSSALYFHSNKNKRPKAHRGLSSQRVSQVSSYYEDPSSLTNDDWENFEDKLLAPTVELSGVPSTSGGKLLSDEIVHGSDLSEASESSDRGQVDTECLRCSKIDDETYLKQLCEEKGFVILSEGDFAELNSKADGDLVLEKQDAQAWKQLSDSPLTFIRKVAKEHDHHLVDSTEYNRLMNPSLEALNKHASSRNSKLISVEDYTSLTNAIENPSRGFLTQKAERLDCFLIDKQYPSADVVNDLTSKLGMVPVRKTEYESLVERLENPSKDFLSTACREKFGLAVVEQSNLDDLKSKLESPSKEYLLLKAKQLNQVILSQDRYTEMQTAIKEPSVEYLTRKADANGLLIVSQQEHRELLRSVREPSLEYLKEMAKQNDHIALTKENYRQLVEGQKELRILLQKTQSPSEEYLNEKAASFGMTLVEDRELKELKSPTLPAIKELASAVDSTVLSNSEYEVLRSCQSQLKSLETKHETTENDLKQMTLSKDEALETTEQLQKDSSDLNAKIDSLNAVLAEKVQAFNAQTEKIRLIEQEHSLLAKNHDLLKNERNQACVLRDEIDDAHRELLQNHERLTNEFDQSKMLISELSEKNESPSKEYLIEKANALGLVSVPQSEFLDINEKLDNPSRDFLAEKAESLFGNILISKNHFEELVSKNEELNKALENPSQTYIQENARLLGLTAVDSLLYNKLKGDLEKPSEDFLRTKAQGAGFVLLEKEKYASLLSRLSHPNEEYLQDKCAALDMVPISNHEYSALRSLQDEPPLQFMKEKALIMGYTIIEDQRLKALENQAVKLEASLSTPSLEYLNEKAKKRDYVLTSRDEYSRLESPSHDWLQSASLKQGYMMITLEDHDALKRASELPSLEVLKSKAAEQGYTLERVQETPDIDDLKESARSLDCVLMTSAEVAALRSTTSENKSHFDPPVPQLEEDKELEGSENEVPDSTLSMDLLREQAEAKSLMLLPLSVCRSLEKVFPKVEDPAFVDEKVSELIELASFDRAEALKNKDLCAPLELIYHENKELLKDHEMPAFFAHLCDEYKRLQNFFKSPSMEFLSEKAKIHQCIAVEEASYNKLLNSISSERGLKESASKLGLVVIHQTDYDKMSSALESPTKLQLAEKANQLSLKLVDRDERLLDECEIADLSLKAKQMGFFMVDKDGWETLHNPGPEFLKSKLETLGFSVLTSAELLTLETQAKENQQALESPKQDYLEGKLAELGYVSVMKSSWEEIQSQAFEPSLDHLRCKAENLECILMEQNAYDDLVLKMENPSFDFVVSQLSKKDMKPVAISELTELHEKAFSPDLTHVINVANNLGMIILPKEEHSQLVENSTNPSREVILDSASKMDLAVISRDDHEELLKPMTVERLETSAQELGCVVSTIATFESLTSKAEQSLDDRATAEGLTLIEPSLLESLNKCAAESLECKASRVGKVLVSEGDYSQSLKTSEHLSLLEKEYQSISKKFESPTEEDLRELAEKTEFKVLSREVLSSLKADRQKAIDDLNVSRQNMEDAEVIKTKARALGYSLVDHDVYNKLLDENSISLEERASQEHMTLMTTEEFTQLVSKAEASLQQRADLAGMALLPESEYKQLTLQISSPSRTFLTEKLSAYGLECEEASRLEALRSIEQHPPMDFLASHVSRVGNVIVPSQEFDDMKSQADRAVKELSDVNEKLTSAQRELKEVDILKSQVDRTAKELSDVNEKLTLAERELKEVDDHKSQADRAVKEMKDLSDVNEKLTSAQRDLKEDIKNLTSQLADPSSLRAAAERVNLKVISVDEFNARSPATVDGLKEIAGDMGYNSIPKPHSGSAISLDDSRSITSVSDYEDAMSHFSVSTDNLPKDNLDEDTLRREAEKMGFHLVPNAEDSDDDSTMDEASIATVEHTITEEQAERFAQLNGLKLVSALEFEGLVNATKKDTETREFYSADDVRSAANDLGLCVIGRSKLQELEAHTSLSQDEVASLSTRLGLLCIPESSFVATNVCRTPTSENVVVIPKTFFTKLAKSHEFIKEATKKGFTLAPVSDSPHVDTTSLEASPGLASAAVISDSYSLPSRSSVGATGSTIASMGGPLSPSRSFRTEISMATNVSLTDKNMIPVITQTIIGEYLFKYYRRLGPLSAISENRHERYFWIHPYSLTLYWSMANPVLGDPAENRIRGAAIIGVESVEDNNPLPPGLHHRSILVHCNDRTIKITCPTRQRHNIWYNSIRYLIQRTTEGISFDETHDNISNEQQYHETLTDEEKAQIERSSSYRHIRPRRSIMRSQSKMFGSSPRSS